MLTFDYFRQESIRKFLADSRRTGRPKAIVIDGCIMVHDLLVIGLATRIGSTPDKVKKKHGRLKPLAREALTDEYIPLRDVILAIADVRNAAAHKTITDSDFEARFVSVWSMVPSGTIWPESVVVRSNYCRAFFSLLLRARPMASELEPERLLFGSTNCGLGPLRRRMKRFTRRRGEAELNQQRPSESPRELLW